MYRLHLEKLARTRLDDVLVDERILDRARLEAAQAEQDQTGKLLSDVLIDSGEIDDWDLAKLVASSYQLPFIDVGSYSIPAQALELLPLDWCRARSIVPIDQFGKTMALACVEVPTPEVIHEIIEKTGCTPFLYAAARRPIRDAIDETLKRRVGRAVVSAVRPYAAVAKAAEPVPVPAQALAFAPSPEAPVPTPAVSAPRIPAPPAPGVSVIAGLPRVSFQLNASAAGLGPTVPSRSPAPHPAAHAAPHPAPVFPAPAAAPIPVPAPRRPTIDRLPRPTAPALPPAPSAAPLAFAAAVPPQAPVARLSPMQQLLSRPSQAPATPAPPPVPAAAHAVPPLGPKLGSRAAPVLPPAAPAGAAAPKGGGGWESIFDIGDSAVKRQSVDTTRRKSVV